VSDYQLAYSTDGITWVRMAGMGPFGTANGATGLAVMWANGQWLIGGGNNGSTTLGSAGGMVWGGMVWYGVACNFYSVWGMVGMVSPRYGVVWDHTDGVILK